MEHAIFTQVTAQVFNSCRKFKPSLYFHRLSPRRHAVSFLPSSIFSRTLNLLQSNPNCRRSPYLASFHSDSFVYSGGDGGGSGSHNGGGGRAGGSGKRSTLFRAKRDEDSATDAVVLDVGGMTCGGCAANVKKTLEIQPEVSSAFVNLVTETAVVWPAYGIKATPNWKSEFGETLANLLTGCGYKTSIRDCRGHNLFNVFERKLIEKKNNLKATGYGLAISCVLCGACFLGHFSDMFGLTAPWLHAFHSTGFHFSLSLYALLGPGRHLISDGIKNIFKGAPNMNSLISLGALSSFSVSSFAALMPTLGWRSFFEQPAMLIAFVLLGRNLEERVKIKASGDMADLLKILPPKARLLLDDNSESSTRDIFCSNLSVGDKVVVLPGDRIPVDGIVKAGRSTVDESDFNGELLPVLKLKGDEVSAGSINLNGRLTIEVERSGGETTLGDIFRLVEEAQNREASVQKLVDKVAAKFTIGVLALSFVTFMFWNHSGHHFLQASIQHGGPFSLAVQLACNVMVISCPCALGLATPISLLVGSSLGARKGLLFRSGDALEKFSMVDTVVFDKTGTLTVGRPVVTKVVTLGQKQYNDWSEAEILMLSAGLESNTIHPFGKAIVDASKALNSESLEVLDGTFKEEPGFGVFGRVDNKDISVGTLEWVQRHGVNTSSFDCFDLSNQSGVYVGINGILAGLIYIEDKIREDASHVVHSLSKQGMSVYMLSGDNRAAAEHVASTIGIPKNKVLSEVKPRGKNNFIATLQNDKRIVAMVGDGINDAAALASSHVGIAIGKKVGAATEVSSVILMRNNLSQLLDALDLSRMTMKTVKQNLWWAFAYNVIGIPVAAGMLIPVTGTVLTPSIAGALMCLSSIGVVANSLFLKPRFLNKPQHHQTLPHHNQTDYTPPL